MTNSTESELQHRQFSSAEIADGALVNLTHDERMAVALQHGQLDKNGIGCVFWLLVIGALALWYMFTSVWFAVGWVVCSIVLIGVHYGCKTWAIVTMNRRHGWFLVNANAATLSKLALVLGTVFLFGYGVWIKFGSGSTP